MTDAQRMVIFDVDGTLVDSQADIIAAMSHAFAEADTETPARTEILSIVGLSLDHAVARLAPQLSSDTHQKMVQWYKEAYTHLRAKTGAAQSSPLYPGARAVLDILRSAPNVTLGVATGKSRRGLDKLLEAHDLSAHFTSQQVSDHHPSKPHPSMIEASLRETLVNADQTVMIGDTSFDMDMAKAAGVKAVGVTWGYHPASALGSADRIIDRFDDLPKTLSEIWDGPQ